MKNRCLVISAEAVKEAFIKALDNRTKINKQSLINKICGSLNIAPLELKATHQDVFLNTNMLALGWIYDDMTETYHKLYESFNETAKQVLIGLGNAGYSKLSIAKAKLLINNIFGGIVHSANVYTNEVSMTNRDKGIRLVIKKEDLR